MEWIIQTADKIACHLFLMGYDLDKNSACGEADRLATFEATLRNPSLGLTFSEEDVEAITQVAVLRMSGGRLAYAQEIAAQTHLRQFFKPFDYN